jgi:myo-inositol catabolism protein IolC
MEIGYSGRLYILAFDHRGSFRRDLFGIGGEPTPAQTEEIAAAKMIVFDGLRAGLELGGLATHDTGVLVDEQFGAEVARLARQSGTVLAMPVEKSDHDLFTFEYGEEFGAHIERFDPELSKVLVRFNPDGDAEGNRIQLGRLKRLADWLHGRRRKFLYELLVPPTDAQLDSVGGDRTRYEAELRPGLIRRGIAAAQEAGIEVDVWKLEGTDTVDDAAALVAQARSGEGRERVASVLLGAGAGAERVEHWLRIAAETDGFCGFAIGRSIWDGPLRAHLSGALERGEAAREIGRRFRHFVDVYERAAGPALLGDR